MPVSKKRKKQGKPVQRHVEPEVKAEGAEHPEGHTGPPPLRAGKPKNPFLGNMPGAHRASQRGR
jgi:hypothetical protein